MINIEIKLNTVYCQTPEYILECIIQIIQETYLQNKVSQWYYYLLYILLFIIEIDNNQRQCKHQILNIKQMFQQTLCNDFPQRKTISFKTTNSKSIIRIQKSKLLPVNFFKPLSIQTQSNRRPSTQQIISTPCFGMHQSKQQSYTLNQQPKQKHDKQQFYSWFSKGMKPLSSRVQTVPVDIDSSLQKKRHLTQRKGRLQRVRSVQQEGVKSTFKMLKKFQNLLGDKLENSKGELKVQSYYKFKIKPGYYEGLQKSYKNNFKLNNNTSSNNNTNPKRGYAQTKYKQVKALNSINSGQKASNFLPTISNG